MNGLLHPERFCGKLSRSCYFEGWYYKFVSPSGRTIVFIPGIATGRDKNEAHAFLQVLDNTQESAYIHFTPEAFSSKKNLFLLQLNHNRFSDEYVDVNIQTETLHIEGHLSFSDVVPFPRTLLRRNIMGPFAFCPLMECIHDVICIKSRLKGALCINGESVVFTGGIGYIEKDRGCSFPSSWVWVQGNRFKQDNTGFMLSIAKIPYLGAHFTGIAGFVYAEGVYHPISTYNGAKIKELSITNKRLQLTLQTPKKVLHLTAGPLGGKNLKAPVYGQMTRSLHENVDAKVSLLLQDKRGNALFEGTSSYCGLEVGGETEPLFGRKNQ